MPDDDFIETKATSVHWYRCKNPTCRRWFNIVMGLNQRSPNDDEFQTSQMNLHLLFCPMCGHKHGA